MENNQASKPASKVGRFMGNLFMTTVIGCISVILIAITAKIIGWILF